MKIPVFKEPKKTLISRQLAEIARVTSIEALTTWEISNAINVSYNTARSCLEKLLAMKCVTTTQTAKNQKNGKFRWVEGEPVPETVIRGWQKKNTKSAPPKNQRDPLVALLFSDRK